MHYNFLSELLSVEEKPTNLLFANSCKLYLEEIVFRNTNKFITREI